MRNILLDWEKFKAEKVRRGYGSLDYVEMDDFYLVMMNTANIEFDCKILKDNGEDQQDFEANYKE